MNATYYILGTVGAFVDVFICLSWHQQGCTSWMYLYVVGHKRRYAFSLQAEER